jgi:hypothetical protein
MDKGTLAMINKPIIITGCARSGTSMTAGIIHLCGGWGGDLCGATRYNPKGQFENLPIVQTYVKPLLKHMRYDPMGQKPLPDPEAVDAMATSEKANAWNKKITNRILEQGYTNSMRWFYKGAKACLLWQLWHRAFPEAQWVITYRRDELIINSCMNTSFMRKYRARGGWQNWIDYHKDRFADMESTGLDICYIDTEQVVNGEWDELESAIEHLGLTWNPEGIKGFVDPKIWQSVK